MNTFFCFGVKVTATLGESVIHGTSVRNQDFRNASFGIRPDGSGATHWLPYSDGWVVDEKTPTVQEQYDAMPIGQHFAVTRTSPVRGYEVIKLSDTKAVRLADAGYRDPFIFSVSTSIKNWLKIEVL